MGPAGTRCRGGVLVAIVASSLLVVLRIVADAEVASASLEFAPIEAEHDPSARYSLPYPVRIPRLLVQGVGGATTHEGSQHFAFDFQMPLGTPVLAARAGLVGRVIDGHTEGAQRPGMESNVVYVLHADGTVASYAHLSPGVEVREGQEVRVGQRLALSGCTGYCAAPHLHFHVAARTADGFRTVPIRFGPPGSPGFVPTPNQYYGARPPSKVRLHVKADGRTLGPQQHVRIERGGSVQLRVYRMRKGAGLVDVTDRPQLSFASMTPWSLDVDERGLVRARSMPGYEEFETEATGAEIYVVIGMPGRGNFGSRQIPFEIHDPPAPGATPEAAAEPATSLR